MRSSLPPRSHKPRGEGLISLLPLSLHAAQMLTLVTACMNREAHLRQALPVWLAHAEVGEVIIVDWSNDRPLAELAATDPRVRVIRAVGEPRWILSYAYNLGVSRASGEVILKCDSDCLPLAETLILRPGPSHFYAGHWQSGSPLGKPSVNGQCLFSRAQFDGVNGYSEFIRTYGRDDEDFYDRLAAAGFERREIPAAQLDFIAHEHDARMANQVDAAEPPGIEKVLRKDPLFNELTNMFLAKALPWGPARPRAHYESVETGPRWEVVKREKASELPIPGEVARGARLHALRRVVAKVVGIALDATQRLDEKACLALITNRLQANARAALKRPSAAG